MAVIRWNPWNFSSIFDEEGIDFPTIPGFSRLGRGLNMYETEDALVAEAALLGVDTDSIDITVEDGVVRISGSRQEDEEQVGKRRYFMNSLTAAYNYSFRLPKGVIQDEEPEAHFEDGILELKFKKIIKTSPKKVKISARSKSTSKQKEPEIIKSEEGEM